MASQAPLKSHATKSTRFRIHDVLDLKQLIEPFGALVVHVKRHDAKCGLSITRLPSKTSPRHEALECQFVHVMSQATKLVYFSIAPGLCSISLQSAGTQNCETVVERERHLCKCPLLTAQPVAMVQQ